MSLLSGEWWIDDSGSATFADGDVGDAGHQKTAWGAAIGLDVEHLEREYDLEFEIDGFDDEALGQAYFDGNEAGIDFEDFKKLHRDEQLDLLKKLGVDKKYLDQGDLFDLDQAPMLQFLEDNGASMEFVKWCLEGGCDARDYALEHLGWVRVAGDNFQFWDLNDALDKIKSFIENEYPDQVELDVDEGDPEEVQYSNDEIGLEELPTRWFESVTLKTLFKAKTGAALKRALSGVAKWRNNPRKKR